MLNQENINNNEMSLAMLLPIFREKCDQARNNLSEAILNRKEAEAKLEELEGVIKNASQDFEKINSAAANMVNNPIGMLEKLEEASLKLAVWYQALSSMPEAQASFQLAKEAEASASNEFLFQLLSMQQLKEEIQLEDNREAETDSTSEVS